MKTMYDNGTGTMTCRRGEIIFREGETGSSMYRILAGGAAVYARFGGEEQKLLKELRPGDYFGEMAVIEISPRSATVVATEDDTRLSVIRADDLGEYLRGNAGELNAIARHLSRRVRELTGDYVEVCDTLRELGWLDTSHDKVSEGLLARVKKFAKLYLSRGRTAEESGETQVPEPRQGSHSEGAALRTETYGAGSVIFREQDPAPCMYDVHSGRVGIYTGYGTKKQRRLTELTPNMFFGEMGLFEGLSRTATAVALEDGTVLEPIGEKDLGLLYEKNPAKVLMVLQHLSSRLRKLTTDYLAACRTLAEAEEQIQKANCALTEDAAAQIHYMNQLLLMPEVLF